MINQVQNLIEQVKAKILGGQSDEQLKEKKARVIKAYEKTEQQLKEVEPVSFQRFFSSLLSPNIFINPEFLILMENALVFIGEIDHLLTDARKKLPIKKFEDLVSITV